jgi:aspartyl-tRNA(Asn)/glutamyl-tRNA(Gln) amidotransferase subunit A
VALSYTLDSVGPLTRSVAEAAMVDACLAGEPDWTPEPTPLTSLRLGMPLGRLFDKMDAIVGERFEAAVRALLNAGAGVEDMDVEPLLRRVDEINAIGSFSAAEAACVHAGVLETRADQIDRRVVGRIRAGSNFAAPGYVKMGLLRKALCDDAARLLSRYDALILPTVATVAPLLAPLEASDAAFSDANMLTLRNTTQFNMLDCCAISLPIPGATLPVGLMLVGARGRDRHLLEAAAAIEVALKKI